MIPAAAEATRRLRPRRPPGRHADEALRTITTPPAGSSTTTHVRAHLHWYAGLSIFYVGFDRFACASCMHGLLASIFCSR
jgi:hypothetical protein